MIGNDVTKLNEIIMKIVNLNDNLNNEDEKLYLLNQVYQTIRDLKSEICIDGNFEPYEYTDED